MNNSPITLVGNLTADAELAFTPSGVARCSFSVAVDHRYMKNDEWQSDTSFLNVIAWKKTAEDFARVAHDAKGTRLIVTGRMIQRQWETTEGEKRNQYEVIADDIALHCHSVESFERKVYTPAGAGAPSRNGGGPPPPEDPW